MPFLGVWHFGVNLHVSDINRFQETLKLPWWLSTAESTCNAGDNEVPGWTPEEEGMAAHSSILAWRLPWTEKPDGLQSTGLQSIPHD